MQKNILKDERGIAFVVEIVLIAVVLGVIGLAVMQFMKAKSGGGSSLIPAKVTLNGNCELKDTDLCKFTNNWQNIKDFSVTSTSTDKDKKVSTGVFEISGDKFHMSSSMDGQENYNLITIGDTSYTLDYSDHKWWEQTSEKSTKDDVKKDFEFKSDDTDKKDAATPKTQYKKVGKEACDKLTCFKYEVIEAGVSGKQFIWFDDRDYLLRREQTTTAEGEVSDMKFKYTKPNIKVPSPTKKGAPAPTAVPGVDFSGSADTSVNE
jgi:outer membrane lipoprotein-sorting protein